MQRIVTGFHSIEEMLKSKTQDELKNASILYSNVGPRVKKILKMAASLGVKLFSVKERELDEKVAHLDSFLQNHKGIVLLIEQKDESILNKKGLDEFIASIKHSQKSVVLLLDGISDCYNMGSIIRSAEQFGCDAVIFSKCGNAGGEEGILKTSAGSASWIDIVEVGNLNTCIERLKKEDFWIYATDMEGQAICNVNFPNRVAIVMGSEGSGTSRLVKKNADAIITIPTCGKIDSLNVSVAAGVIMYEIRRKDYCK